MRRIDRLRFGTALREEVAAFRFRMRRKNSLAIFNWHQVTPEFDRERHHTSTWTPLSAFNAAIDELAESHRILPLDEALAAIDNGTLLGRCAALTFDDGDRSMADHVMPLLARRGLPATFFINSAYLRGDRTYWFPILAYAGDALPDELKQCGQMLRLASDPILYAHCRERIEQCAGAIPSLSERLVTAEWLAGLDGTQFAIGAHGHEHQRYSMMPEAWQRRDLADNLAALKQFRAFRPIFAAPFGRPIDVSPELGRIAVDAKVKVVLAGGGINVARAPCYDRIPADSVAIGRALTCAMAAGWRRVANAA